MQHIRFIHCADLHLDSRMESHLSQVQAQTRRKELLQTFLRLADYAVSNQVCAILISGDLFDTDHVAPSTVSAFRNCIQEHPQVDFLYLPGNHDSQIQNIFHLEETWPKNFWIFQDLQDTDSRSGSSLQVCTAKEYGPVTITAVTEDLSSLSALSPSRINFVMLHGQIDSYRASLSDNQEQCFHYSLTDLCGKNIDYIAAGHIHQYRLDAIDMRGQYCYSGCLEGRGFDECGDKGFVLLDIIIDDDAMASPDPDHIHDMFQVTPQFIPFASRKLYDLSFDLTNHTDYHDLDQQISQLFAEIDTPHMVRLKLTGSIPPEYIVPTDWLLQKYADYFFLLRIEDCTRSALSYEDYRYDISLKGEFIRLVLSDPNLNASEKEQIIMEGLHALAGEEILINP